MRVFVDTNVCQAHGDCVLTAPAVFDLDDEGNVVSLLDSAPEEELWARVREAADLCPTNAIRIEE